MFNFVKLITMKLENLKVEELNAQELVSIDGGKRLPSWEKIKEIGAKILVAIESIDIVDRFMDGWNSHRC